MVRVYSVSITLALSSASDFSSNFDISGTGQFNYVPIVDPGLLKLYD